MWQIEQRSVFIFRSLFFSTFRQAPHFSRPTFFSPGNGTGTGRCGQVFSCRISLGNVSVSKRHFPNLQDKRLQSLFKQMKNIWPVCFAFLEPQPQLPKMIPASDLPAEIVGLSTDLPLEGAPACAGCFAPGRLIIFWVAVLGTAD